MLILTRQIGEKIIIGENEIQIVVLDVKSHQVRLGITAPATTPVHRKEIYDRIQREKENASN
jgi:carbon storage regulator